MVLHSVWWYWLGHFDGLGVVTGIRSRLLRPLYITGSHSCRNQPVIAAPVLRRRRILCKLNLHSVFQIDQHTFIDWNGAILKQIVVLLCMVPASHLQVANWRIFKVSTSFVDRLGRRIWVDGQSLAFNFSQSHQRPRPATQLQCFVSDLYPTAGGEPT